MSLTMLRAEIEASDRDTVQAPAVWESYDLPIEYGLFHENHEFCHSKDLTYLCCAEENAVKNMMGKVGLPFHLDAVTPGSNYSLLSLRNHGLVMKVGRGHDPIDLIHPCFSQALVWVRDAYTNLTLCIYAGEKLSTPSPDRDAKVIEMCGVVTDTGQKSHDIMNDVIKHVVHENIGFFQINGSQELPLLIDVDRNRNETHDHFLKQQKQDLATEKWNRPGINNADSHREILHAVYGEGTEHYELVKEWLPQFDRHQELRRAFWESQASAPEDKLALLKNFWDMAAEHTHNPSTEACRLHREYLQKPAP